MKTTRMLMLGVLASIVLSSVSLAVPGMLKEDPALVKGTLPNGLDYIVRNHKNPPGKMSILIHIRTGSLNESDDQRGIAHFTEHMAFNGSQNFPPGKVIEYFESIGMEFGGDINAFTSYDQTCYMLDLPDCKEETIDQGLLCLSDQAFRLLFLEEEIEKERGVIVEEWRSRNDKNKRVRDQLFAALFEGSRFVDRDIIGLTEQIKKWKQKDFQDYYNRWYRPDAMTLIVVGDADPKKIIPLIKKNFGSEKPKSDRSVPHLAGFMPSTRQKAALITDPEVTGLDIELVNVAPLRPPVTTEGRFRENLVVDLAGWIMNRRIQEEIQKGKTAFQDGGINVFDFYNEAVLEFASCSGEPEQWKAMLEQLVSMVKQGVDHGFTEHELEQAKAETLSSAKLAAERESTQLAGRLRMQYAFATHSGDTITSAKDDLKLIEKLLKGITVKDVNKAFHEHFARQTFTFVMTGPDSPDVKLPTEKEILEAGQKAFEVKTAARAEKDRPDSILQKLPEPGKIKSETHHDELNVTTATFENNVIVHHRFMDDREDTVLVSITIPGGTIEENTNNRGITNAASLVLSQPATSKLSSTDIRDLLTGKNISVGGGSGADTISISVAGDPADLEPGLQVAWSLLTDGKLEESALSNWKKEKAIEIEGNATEPFYTAFKVMRAKTSGDDPRQIFLTVDNVEKQNLNDAQAWYDRIVKSRPMEVAIVGDIDKKTALELAARYLGSLNKRPERAKDLDKLRSFKRENKPQIEFIELETLQPFGVVISGFMGCESSQVIDRRTLNLAQQTLDSRLIKDIREEKGWVYSISVANQPSTAYKDAGIFCAFAPTNPPYIKDLEKRVTEMMDEFAKKGQTPTELETAKKQIFNELDKQWKEPRFWLGELSDLHYHNKSLDDLAKVRSMYESFTAEDVVKVFNKYYKPERKIQISVAPKPPAETKK